MDENEPGEGSRWEEAHVKPRSGTWLPAEQDGGQWLKHGIEPRGDSEDLFAEVNRSWIMERQTREQLEENKQRGDVILFILKEHCGHNLENGRIVHKNC